MTRVRTDDVFGTTTDNPLTSGATTMNSAGLANLGVVSSAEAFITLDPRRLTGAPEIVVVTAHTGSATSATIQRGQFGTAARQHASGTEWVHGPIASNTATYVTAADDQGDFVPMNGYESFTPTLVQSGAVTKTVNNARFLRIGRMIHVMVELTVTGTGTAANAVRVGLPVSAAAGGVGSFDIGVGHIYDTSVPTLFTGNVNLATADAVQFWPSADGAATALGVRAFTAALASGDLVRYSALYEAAT